MSSIELSSDISYSFELVNPCKQLLRHISDDDIFAPERKLKSIFKADIPALPSSLQDALERVHSVGTRKRKCIPVFVG